MFYSEKSITHCLYRFLDGKKLATSNLPFQAFQGYTPKTKIIFQISQGFCEKILNHGFGGPWDILWIFFLIAIFIMLQKNYEKYFCFRFL